MADVTINASPFFVAGDVLNAYVFPSDDPDGRPVPVAAFTSATVASTGTATFTGLADATTYWIGTNVAPYRFIHLSTAPASSTAPSEGSGDGTDATARASIASHLADAAAAHDASAIAFTPVGSLSATTVQAAIVEAAAEATGAPGPAGPPGTVTSAGGLILEDLDVPGDSYQVVVRSGRFGLEVVGAAFTPGSLPALEGWWETMDLAGSDGTQLASWADLGPGAHNLAQGSVGLRPTIETISGVRVLRFEAGGWVQGAWTLAQPTTTFFVARRLGAYAANVNLLDGANYNTNGLIHNDPTGVAAYAGGSFLPNYAVNPQAWNVYEFTAAGASSSYSVNGSAAVTGDAGSAASGGVTVAASAFGSDAASIEVAALIICGSNMAADDRAATRAYLNAIVTDLTT